MNRITLTLTLAFLLASCGSPSSETAKPFSATFSTFSINKTPVGGHFEHDDLTFLHMPGEIAAVDTSPGWGQEGQRLRITGTVLQPDGKTPASGVVIYYYHTDVEGLYSQAPDGKPSIVHGYIRGWVRSDSAGRYAIYTVRPAPYPSGDLPAHIHPVVMDPAVGTYYIEDFLFDDDPILTAEQRAKLDQRGGSGIMQTQMEGDLQVAHRDIVLGLNVPDYPR